MEVLAPDTRFKSGALLTLRALRNFLPQRSGEAKKILRAVKKAYLYLDNIAARLLVWLIDAPQRGVSARLQALPFAYRYIVSVG